MKNLLNLLRVIVALLAMLAIGPAQASQPLTGVVQIAAGYDYACALTATGTVLCWGTNQAGQLGDGSTTARELAKPVSGIGQATAIAVGYQHSCAVDAGLVKCWGQNDYGQLGPGSMNPSLVPFTVPGITGATAVAVSYSHTCALVGGAVKCWGANMYGQVGNGSSSTVVATPFSTIPSGATAIAAANGQTCAIVGGGAVQCWGWNQSGQLGTGDETHRLSPTTIIPNGATAIALGSGHSCAIVAGTLKCWGINVEGQLGTGNQTQSLVPTATQGLSGSVTTVATGLLHTCAIINNGSTQCWGKNNRGQLGIGTLTEFDYRTVPQTSTVSGASALAAGAEFSCAIVAGAVKCWGSNRYGQLGNGVTEIQRAHVVAIPAGANATAISSRQDHGCAVVNGAVKCWGHNPSGPLGDDTTLARATPVGVSGLVSGATAVAAGGEHSCAIVAGAVKCWGSNARGQLGSGGPATLQTTPVNVAGLTTGVTAIAAGFEHTCALKGGQVSCWGSNQYGQIGTGNTLPAPMPQVVITENATAITAGGAHTCAIVGLGGRDPTKVVKCWGLNYWGQIGDNSTTDRLSPVEVFSSDTIAIAAGGSHTCLIAKVNPPFDSVTKCWGYNNKGQIGDGTINVHPKVPTNVQGLYGATAISVGGEHTCAIVGTNRSLRCWGLNAFGQVTDADTDREPLPVTLADTGVDKVAASSYHTCALASGGVTCWGWNYLGQLGDGKSGISPQTVLVTWPPPDPPTLVRLQPIDQGMRVYFTPPASDNGTDIDSYTATCTPTGGTPVSLTGTTSPLTVTGLVNGVSYLCTVSATSTAGTSSASGAMTRVVRKGDLTPILMLLLD